MLPCLVCHQIGQPLMTTRDGDGYAQGAFAAWARVFRVANEDTSDQAPRARSSHTRAKVQSCRRPSFLVRDARDFDCGWSRQKLAQLTHPIARCLGRAKPSASFLIDHHVQRTLLRWELC